MVFSPDFQAWTYIDDSFPMVGDSMNTVQRLALVDVARAAPMSIRGPHRQLPGGAVRPGHPGDGVDALDRALVAPIAEMIESVHRPRACSSRPGIVLI